MTDATRWYTVSMNIARCRHTAIVVGPVVGVALAIATAPIRGSGGSTNVGVLLAVVVAAAALFSRVAGLLTGACAALAFNFFHTRPYHSLSIDSPSDVVIVALLATLGLAVSDLDRWRRNAAALADRRPQTEQAHDATSELLAVSRPVQEIWPLVVASTMDQLWLADCRFVREPLDGLPVVSRHGAMGSGAHGDTDGELVLPTSGAAVPVVAAGVVLGHLIVTPQPGLTSLRVQRRVLLALADHVALVLADPLLDEVDGERG